MNSWMEGALDILFPRRCVSCGRLLADREKKAGFCSKCRKELVFIGEPSCRICGKPLAQEEAECCFDCTKIRHRFTQSKALFLYTGPVKSALYHLKYGNQRGAAKIFGRAMARTYDKWIAACRVDVVTQVPMHAAKKRARGYDQAALIAKTLAKESGLLYEENLLVRTRQTRPQKELNNAERRKNLKNAFKIGKSSVKSKRVLIVDDIYTTGASFDACAEVLLKNGAKAVYGMTVVTGRGV